MVVVAHGVRGQPLRAARGAPLDVYIGMCVCVCVCERERERERENNAYIMRYLAGKAQNTDRLKGNTLERVM